MFQQGGCLLLISNDQAQVLGQVERFRVTANQPFLDEEQ